MRDNVFVNYKVLVMYSFLKGSGTYIILPVLKSISQIENYIHAEYKDRI